VKVKFITYDSCFGNGAQTLAQNTINHLGGELIVVSLVGEKSKPSFTERAKTRQRQKVKDLFGQNVLVATTDEEILNFCSDADIVFVTMFIKNIWPNAEKTLGMIKAPKVVFSLGTQEFRPCGEFYRLKVWDAWWSERPLIRKFNIAKGFVKTDTKYVIGCNVYDLKCTLTPTEVTSQRDPLSLISSSRWSNGKGSIPLLDMYGELYDMGQFNLGAWGWNSDEGSMAFFSSVKSHPQRSEIWKKIKPIIKGKYDRSNIPEIFGGENAPRFAIDLTKFKGDGTQFGDGGLQYCQAEALDYGSIPIVDRAFHPSDEWDKIIHRVPDACYDAKGNVDGVKLAGWISSLMKNWNFSEHVDRISLGREYIKKNLSIERFNQSMDELTKLLL